MTGRRKKYEEAKGVVALRWHRGSITPNEVGARGRVLAEVWTAEPKAGWAGSDYVRMQARLVILTCHPDGYMLADAKPLTVGEMVRRWTYLGATIANISLTLNTWPEP